MKNKIVNRKNISKLVRILKKQRKRIVFTNGCFDLVHQGHISYLYKAKKFGDILIIGVNSDRSVKDLKGKTRPIFKLKDRLAVLNSLEMIDYIIVFNDKTPINIIKIIKPDYHVKGGDYKLNDLPERKIVESFKGKVKIIPLIKGRSTTSIINKIKKI